MTLFQPKDVDEAYSPDADHLEFEKLIAGVVTIGELIQEFERLAQTGPAHPHIWFHLTWRKRFASEPAVPIFN